jgi:hypothetical protein
MFTCVLTWSKLAGSAFCKRRKSYGVKNHKFMKVRRPKVLSI